MSTEATQLTAEQVAELVKFVRDTGEYYGDCPNDVANYRAIVKDIGQEARDLLERLGL